MPLDLYIIAVFCFVESAMNKIFPTLKLRQSGPSPQLLDSEVICMEIVGEFLSIDYDKKIWEYFKNHWKHFFPKISCRTSFTRQAANLIRVKQEIHGYLIKELHANSDPIHMLDGFPISICILARANRCKSFKGIASYSYCASKKEYYYGFHGNVVISFDGAISGFTVTAANVDERESIFEITDNISGLLIGDKGYISNDLKNILLKERKIDLQTPLRDNMIDTRDKNFVKMLTSTRRKVETVIGQLADRFNSEYANARDIWHLSNRFIRKILSHNVSVFLNKFIGNEPLQFEKLVSQ